MENITDTSLQPITQTAVALGLFDGLHLGHQQVIHRAVDCIPKGLAPAVFTFETETLTTKGQGGVDVILAQDLKQEFLSKLGVEYLYSPDFSDFKDLLPEEFVKIVLIGRLNARYVICGDDFRFGKGGRAGPKDLAELGRPMGLEVILVPPMVLDAEIVSSTLIRKYVQEGQLERANQLLGYDFTLRLSVIHGRQLGRTLHFPTINQMFSRRQLCPKFGVYASRTLIGDRNWISVTNVGLRPTVGGSDVPLAETHILGYSGDLYGENIQVKLRQFIRPEQTFPDLAALQKQVFADMSAVRELHNSGAL